jgi:hypothetical protein
MTRAHGRAQITSSLCRQRTPTVPLVSPGPTSYGMVCSVAELQSPKVQRLRRRPNRRPRSAAPVPCSWQTIPLENAAEKFWRSKPRHEARRTAACRSTSNPFLAASASGIALLSVASWLLGESLPQSTRLEELFLILDAALSLDLLLQR